MTSIRIPEGALVLTFGGSGSGKSTFVSGQFAPTEIVSSDVCRAMVSDDATDQQCNKQAFEVFHAIIGARLALGKTVVADATNLQAKSRTHLRQMAEKAKAPVVVLVFDRSLETVMHQNAQRPDRQVPEFVVLKHFHQMLETLAEVEKERYSAVHFVPVEGAKIQIVGGVEIVEGPGFDVIGDIHGCIEELKELLTRLGYVVHEIGEGFDLQLLHPDGRKLVFVGDFTDRGPDSVAVLRWVRLALHSGHKAVRGNHDNKLWKALKGNKVQLTHGLAETMLQIDAECLDDEKLRFREMLGALPYQLILRTAPHADVIVTHAGIPVSMIGRDTDATRAHSLFGEVQGQGEDGYPIRGSTYQDGWVVAEHAPVLVHGHSPVPSPYPTRFLNYVNVDQGCCFGGKLTAFLWPRGDFTQVDAHRKHAVHRDAEFGAL